jgi:hypothetical protein
MGALDTVAISLLALFLLGLTGMLWTDWRHMTRGELEKRSEPLDDWNQDITRSNG